jgi:hypothetical protein
MFDLDCYERNSAHRMRRKIKFTTNVQRVEEPGLWDLSPPRPKSKEHSHLQKSAKKDMIKPCDQCHDLNNQYWKAWYRDIKRSAFRGCHGCCLVMEALAICSTEELTGDEKVRIFAPLSDADSRKILCQWNPPWMIEVFSSSDRPGKLLA